MNNFALYFDTGWQHIISWDARDHILFIGALCAVYLLSDWKQVLILVTAFTIGHTLTLALSAYDVFRVKASWVEFLIPCTIIVTAALNSRDRNINLGHMGLKYFTALFFGLVHGMGFANSIRFMLASEEAIGIPLLAFNLGLEAGQVLVVTIILLLSDLCVKKLRVNRRGWVWGISGLATIAALEMLLQRWAQV